MKRKWLKGDNYVNIQPIRQYYSLCVLPFNFTPFCTFQDMTRTGNHYEKWLWGDNTIHIQSRTVVLVHSTCALFDISQDQRAQYVYTLISLFFLSANLIYIIVLKKIIFESKVFLILKMSLLWHSFVNGYSISVLVFVVWETLLKMISAVSWK